MMNDLDMDFPTFEPGWVWLVGAGPGDPGLLTLHALHALKSADVIVHDALVDDRILAMAPKSAVLESMGKRGGKASPKQTEITARLIDLAKQGKRVLRLKGGDPFVFGRGPEEAEALVAEQISFRVVPGITAGIAGLAYAGIPVTAKATNSAVAFVTGHSETGEVPDSLDWHALAKSAAVVVVYMPMRHLEGIRSKFLAAGRSPDEAAAIVSKACTPEQEVLETTIGTCVEDAAKAGMKPPSLLVIGEVVRLRETLSWWTP